MISFPLLQRIEVQGYEMYPGTADRPGLDASFAPGVTLIIGANGLGKSTLVALLYRVLSGPCEISGQERDTLGSGQLDLRGLRSNELRAFAARVRDGANDAVASIRLGLGGHSLELSRELRSLALTSLTVDGDSLEPSEERYREAVLDSAGLSSFLDWMLILRYLVFYFDDRRSLVWDPTAQRRLLRLLFLPSNQTEPQSELVKRLLSMDSYYRNVSATLTRQEREFHRQEQAAASQPTVEEQLAVQSDRLRQANEQLESLQLEFAPLSDRRATARLTALRAEQEQQQALTEIEYQRLQQIQATFPTQSETAAYWLTQVVAEADCIVCGSSVPELARELAQRIERSHCVLCNSAVSQHDPAVGNGEVLRLAQQRLRDATVTLELAVRDRDEAEENFTWTLRRMAELEREVSKLSTSIEQLEAALPDQTRSLSARRQALVDLRHENERVREEVLADKARYRELVAQENLYIANFQQSVKETFDKYAKDFLLESCALVWGQANEQIGQIGQPIKFSVFHVDMTGGAVDSATRRESADQVSESQREYIDIAFRMALIIVAGAEHAGTLVIDAPETSLDAVFAPRAARVLADFGTAHGESRLILTSNLVDGQLIPTIAYFANIADVRDPRVVNLFEIAAPTAAVRELRSDYEAALRSAFARPRGLREI